MIDLLKAYWPYILGTVFFLVGHVPIRAALKPAKYSRADKILAAWEALSVDARKLAKSQGKKIPWLEPMVLVIDAVYPVPEELASTPELRPPPPDSTTKPITIEPEVKPPPKLCNGCGKPLLPENAWMTDRCPCNSPLGINDDPPDAA